MGRMVWGDHISRVSRADQSRPPAYFPESSWAIIHFVRSPTLVMIPPAGSVLLIVSRGEIPTAPFDHPCGVAASAPGREKAPISDVVSVMPRGVRMRSWRFWLHDLPVTASITRPAAM